MDFRLPDTHTALAELAGTILREHASPERLTKLEREGDWLDRDLWSALAASGLVGVSLPEEIGGAGLDALADHVLLRELGATAAHVPLAETVLAAGLIDRVGAEPLRTEVLTAVTAGRTSLALALQDEDSDDVHVPTARAEADGDALVLTGTKTTVACAPVVDDLLLTARTPEGQDVLALVAAADVTVEAQRTPSDVPIGLVRLDRIAVPVDRILARGAEATEALADLVLRARAATASVQAGTVAEAVRLAAQHTSTREQFGRAIATFQAVRQRVADARIASEMLELTSLQAQWLLAEARPAAEAVTIAAWWAGEAGHVALHAVHHVHGGIGVDREYPLHRLFGRAKAVEFAMSNGEQLLADLGARIAASVPEDAST